MSLQVKWRGELICGANGVGREKPASRAFEKQSMLEEAACEYPSPLALVVRFSGFLMP